MTLKELRDILNSLEQLPNSDNFEVLTFEDVTPAHVYTDTKNGKVYIR